MDRLLRQANFSETNVRSRWGGFMNCSSTPALGSLTADEDLGLPEPAEAGGFLYAVAAPAQARPERLEHRGQLPGTALEGEPDEGPFQDLKAGVRELSLQLALPVIARAVAQELHSETQREVGDERHPVWDEASGGF